MGKNNLNKLKEFASSEKNKNKIYWIGILSFTVIISSHLGLFWLSFLLMTVIVGRLLFNLGPTTLLTIITICVAVVSLNNQNEALKNQLKRDCLDKRPYIFADFNFKNNEWYFRANENDLRFGADITIKNTGRMPAKINLKESKYFVCDEYKCHDLRGWYVGTFGGFPDFNLIAPNSEITRDYFVGLLPESKYGYIGVYLKYSGIDSKTDYWYVRLDKFNLQKDINGSLKDSKWIGHNDDWDENNSKKKVLKLDESNYQKFIPVIGN